MLRYILKKKEIYEKDIFINNMLVDCLTNMISNIIFENIDIEWSNPAKDQIEKCDEVIEKEVEKLIEISQKFENVIIVSNELGMGIVPSYPLGRYFREIAGKMNQKIAEIADEVFFCCFWNSYKNKIDKKDYYSH